MYIHTIYKYKYPYKTSALITMLLCIVVFKIWLYELCAQSLVYIVFALRRWCAICATLRLYETIVEKLKNGMTKK